MALPLSVLSFLVFGAVGPRVAHAFGPGFTEYSLNSGYDRPLEMVNGPDGNLWFTELTGKNIGTITTSGTITEYPIPNYSGFLGTGGIAVGTDGNVWFTDLSNNTVGKITTAGTVTEYTTLSTASADPEWMTAGPDGNLWFTESNANFVGKVTTSGAITEYAITAGASSAQIATGPDGDLWFAEQSLNMIGHIAPSGTYNEFSLASGASPDGVVAGPDGNMWVAESGTGNIDKVSTAGTVLAQYPLLASGASPADMTVGSDGNLWVTEYGGNALARITTGGVITEYSTGGSGSPLGITSGSDGNIWYSEYHGDAVGRFSLNPCASLTDSASQSPIGAGAAETISVTLTSCGVAPVSNATTTTTTTSPPECPAAPAIPSFATTTLPFGQTDAHTTTVAGPSCPGTYAMMSQTTMGATVMATGTATYQVLALGDGILFSTNSFRPTFVTAGSDGNIWGGIQGDPGANLFQLTPAGSLSLFQFQPGVDASQITTGPDGNLYIRVLGNRIAQIPPGNPTLLNWEVPVPSGAIDDLTPGPDGNVWYVTQTSTGGAVGFVTPAAKFKQFTLPAGTGIPQAITAGSDGALWFNLSSGMIGRITTSGAMTFFAIPGVGTTGAPDFGSGGTVTLGPDGNVWFTAGSTSHGDVVGDISPAGVVRTFHPPTANVEAGGITAGADGNLWFNEIARQPPGCTNPPGTVARITLTGVITEYAVDCADTNDTFNIVAGPDGNVWNGAYYGIGVAMIEIAAPSTCTPLAAMAQPATVAPGASELIAATIANCGNTPKLMKVVSKTTPPSACGAPVTKTSHVPLQPRVQTVVSSAFTASRCKGTYTDKITLSSGGTVIATKTVTYKIT